MIKNDYTHQDIIIRRGSIDDPLNKVAGYLDGRLART